MLVALAELVITIPLPKNRVVNWSKIGLNTLNLGKSSTIYIRLSPIYDILGKSREENQSWEFALVDCPYPPSPSRARSAASFWSKASKLNAR